MTAQLTLPEDEALPSDGRGARLSKSTFTVAVLLVYLALGLVAFRPAYPWNSARIFGTAGDSVLAMWFLAWIPHSLAHGLNPFFSHAIFVPSGVNLSQNTTAPFLGLLTAPFGFFMSPVARANLLMVIAMPLSATSLFVVLKRWSVWAPAAALAGLIYGFSPYAVGQGLGHVVLVFLPLPPLIAYTLSLILQRRGSPWRLGFQLGLLIAAQFLSEPEVMTTVALMSIFAVICAAVRVPSRVVAVGRDVMKPFAIAIAVSVAILGYPIWMLLKGPQHYKGTAQALGNPYYNDLLSFITPGPLQKVSLGLRSIGVPLSNPSEAGSYIGVPLLLVALCLAWRSRRRARTQLAVAVFLGGAVLSLGPRLVVDGHNTGVRMPFTILEHVPLLNNILASRISLEVDAALAVIIAFGIDDLYQRNLGRLKHGISRRRLSHGLVVSAVLVVLVVTQLPDWPYASQAVAGLPRNIVEAIPKGNPVTLTYPYASPVFVQPMLWQAQEGFTFNLLGGYAEHPDLNDHPTGFPNPIEPPGLEQFLEGQEGYNPYLPKEVITPSIEADAKAAFVRNDIRVVIVDMAVPGSSGAALLFRKVLGRPNAVSGSFLAWFSETKPL